MPGDARQALSPCQLLGLHLSVDVAGGVPRAASAHGVESNGLLGLLVDGGGGLGGWGRPGSPHGARVDFRGQLWFGVDRRLGSGRRGRLGGGKAVEMSGSRPPWPARAPA